MSQPDNADPIDEEGEEVLEKYSKSDEASKAKAAARKNLIEFLEKQPDFECERDGKRHYLYDVHKAVPTKQLQKHVLMTEFSFTDEQCEEYFTNLRIMREKLKKEQPTQRRLITETIGSKRKYPRPSEVADAEDTTGDKEQAVGKEEEEEEAEKPKKKKQKKSKSDEDDEESDAKKKKKAAKKAAKKAEKKKKASKEAKEEKVDLSSTDASTSNPSTPATTAVDPQAELKDIVSKEELAQKLAEAKPALVVQEIAA